MLPVMVAGTAVQRPGVTATNTGVLRHKGIMVHRSFKTLHFDKNEFPHTILATSPWRASESPVFDMRA